MPEVGGEARLPLFGRGLESERLAAFVGGTRERGGALLVRGEAGIGKSALLAEVVSLAADDGLRVVSLAGAEAEQHVPYAGLQQLVHPLRSGIDALPGPQREALRTAMGLADGAAPAVYLVGLAVLNLLSEAAADKPLVLVADDAHWLDQASADVLAFVARRLESEPIVLIAALRDGVQSSLDAAGLPLLQVDRLTDKAAAALLSAVSPDLGEAMTARLLTAAAGNPLALTELPGTANADSLLTATLPLSVRLEQAFGVRAASLPTETRIALLVASLNDGDALAETFEAAGSALGTTVGVAVLSPAVEAGLIEIDAGKIVSGIR